MKIYDISQEVFGCEVYPGDPAPKKETLSSIAQGDLYNLTAFSMCAHNGTHIDAPFHFLQDGKTVEQMALDKMVGFAVVAAYDGELDGYSARAILERARASHTEAAKRLLLKGNVIVSTEAAQVFAEEKLTLLAVEGQTVGPEEAPMAAHLALLGAETVILEGVRLSMVPEGVYVLCAAPLALGGADGAPCRAVLMDIQSMIGE